MKAQHWRTSKLREDMKTKSRCQGKVKRKKRKKTKKILNYTMFVGIYGRTSYWKKYH